MKPSTLTTEQGFDALIAIAPEIQPMLLDDAFMAELRKGTADRDKAAEVGIQKIAALVPLFFGKYRSNTLRILGALNGKSPEEVAGQKMTETIRQLWEIFRDKDLLDFFQSLGPAGREK